MHSSPAISSLLQQDSSNDDKPANTLYCINKRWYLGLSPNPSSIYFHLELLAEVKILWWEIGWPWSCHWQTWHCSRSRQALYNSADEHLHKYAKIWLWNLVFVWPLQQQFVSVPWLTSYHVQFFSTMQTLENRPLSKSGCCRCASSALGL